MPDQTNINQFSSKSPIENEDETIRLKYLAHINPSKSEVSNLDPEMEISFVPLEDFSTDGEIKNTETRMLKEVYDGYTYFREGDIAIAKITPSFENGKGAICNGLKNDIGFGTTELHILRPRKGVSTEFLWYVLRSKRFIDEAETAMRGVAGQKRVPSEFLKRFQIRKSAVRAGDEAVNEIKERLSHIDALISANNKLRKKLRIRQQSLVSELFQNHENEEKVKLKYISDLLPGYAFPSDNFSNDNNNIRLLRGVNVGTGGTKWEETEYWGGELDKYSEYRLQEGDVVLAMDRPWINDGIRIAQLTESDCPALLVQRVLRIRSNSEVLQSYIRIALESTRFKQYFDPILTGVSVPHISKDQVGEFEIPLPSIKEQQNIVSKWENYREKKADLENKSSELIDHLKQKRQALITAAVTGQIDISQDKDRNQPSV